MILSPLISNEKNKVSPTGSVVGGSYYSSPGILKPLSVVNANQPKPTPVVQKQEEPVKKQEQSVFKKISESVSSFFSNLSLKSKKLNEMANIKTTDIGPVDNVSINNIPKISNSIVKDTSAMITPEKKLEVQKKLEATQKKFEASPIGRELNRLENKTTTTDKLDWKDRVYKIIDKGEDTPFIGDAVVISKFIPLVTASNRLREGKGTLKDAQLLQEWLGQENREKTTGYKIMDGLINSATFMAELYASAGSYTLGKELSEKAAKKSVQWLLTKAGKEATEEALQKWGPKLATKVIQGVAGETVRTIVKAPLTVTKGTLENQIKSNIEVISGVTDTKESISKSITKSFLDSWVENVSERGGDVMGEVVTKISKPLRDKLIKNAMYNTLIKLAPEKSKIITNFFQKAGYDGFIYEVGEERIGDITRGLLYEVGLSDQKFDPKAIKDNFFVELAVLTVPGTVQYAGNTVLSKFDKTPNITNIVMRPDEAVAGVEQFKLNETPDGARILAAAEQAAQEGKSVEIINTDKGLNIKVVKTPVETDSSLKETKTIDPAEARNIVINSSLENTEVGKKIIKTSLEAEDQGKQVVVSKNISEIKVAEAEKPTQVKEVTLFNGSNKQVTEVKKTYDNVLVVQTNQAELIKKLANEGNTEAKKLYDSMPDKTRVDFTIADPIIKEAYGDQYDAIRYENTDRKQIGPEYHDLKDGKFYAVNKETASVYALQNREGKYKETKQQEIVETKEKEFKPIKTKVEDYLISEAKKYKNSSEFVADKIFNSSLSGKDTAYIENNFKGKTFADKLTNFYDSVSPENVKTGGVGGVEKQILYHGTTVPNVTKLKPGGVKGRMGEDSIPGISLTNDLSTANYYASKNGIQINSPIKTEFTGKTLNVDSIAELKQKLGLNDWSDMSRKKIPELLKQQGYDAVSIKGYGDIGEIIVTNPNSVKIIKSQPIKTDVKVQTQKEYIQPEKQQKTVEKEIISKKITEKERIEGAKKPVEDTKGATKLSRVAERVYDQLIGIKDQDISYNPMSIVEDAARASELVQQDEATALRIAKGLELPPPDITETAISIAMAQKALDDGNFDLYSKLIASRTLRQTRRGQEIVAERGRMDENSSEFFIRKLLDERAKIVASGKKWLFDKETKMEQYIKKEVGELKKTIDRKVLNKLESAQKLIDSLTCKI